MLPDDMAKQVVQNLLPTRQKAVVVKGRILSEVTKQYVMAKESGWSAKSKMEFKGIFRLLLDTVGDVDIATITKPVVLELRATFQRLPANIYKKYPGKTIQQVLAETTLEPMSIKSVNKHVARLGSLLRYCMEEGIIHRNPASGLKIPEKKRADEERKAYSKEDVANIIKSLPNNPSTPERYWIPLIGLYSGMRLNEISQLYHSDIIQFDGIWCFSINNEIDKRLKNDASERIIPIHPNLLNLGLIEYVNEIKKKKLPRLWMNLTYCEIAGYSNIFGKWYQRYNRSYVTADPLKVFHSMRHTVTDMLKQASVIETVIAELVGHSNNASMTMGRYGKRYQPKVLLDALMKLDYGISD
jgi:integrase